MPLRMNMLFSVQYHELLGWSCKDSLGGNNLVRVSTEQIEMVRVSDMWCI